jgi:two-component system, OmpR family, response regulator MtrA
MLGIVLRSEGFLPSFVADGERALSAFRESRPDIVLLDLMLPGMSGVELCRTIRKTSSVPIIMLTAKDSEVDKVVGLELGADDYVTKPFSVREVLARINAVLRRSNSADHGHAVPERESIGAFTIDRAARRVRLDGSEIRLTGREFDLLSHLLAHSGRVQSRDALLENVWGYEFMGDRKTVDVHVRWLREKFVGRAPFDIATVRGIGYRLDRQEDPG